MNHGFLVYGVHDKPCEETKKYYSKTCNTDSLRFIYLYSYFSYSLASHLEYVNDVQEEGVMHFDDLLRLNIEV